MADPYAHSRGTPEVDRFWNGLRDGSFLLQHCTECGQVRFPVTAMCPRCHSLGHEWRAAAGTGSVWSVTRVERAPTPDLASSVPYWLVAVELDEGPLVLSRMTEAASDSSAAIGRRVQLVIDDPTDEPHTRYWFTPLPDPGEPRSTTAL